MGRSSNNVSFLIVFLVICILSSAYGICQPPHNGNTRNISSYQSTDFLNRTKRATTSTNKVLPWRRIYTFTKKFAKIAGNNALLSNVNDMLVNKAGGVSKAYTYGYRRGYGGGYGGGGYGGYPYGYGGYSYMAQPIVYYVPVQTAQYAVPVNNIYGFTGGFGDTVSDSELLEQLISLIQIALDEGGDSTGK